MSAKVRFNDLITLADGRAEDFLKSQSRQPHLHVTHAMALHFHDATSMLSNRVQPLIRRSGQVQHRSQLPHKCVAVAADFSNQRRRLCSILTVSTTNMGVRKWKGEIMAPQCPGVILSTKM